MNIVSFFRVVGLGGGALNKTAQLSGFLHFHRLLFSFKQQKDKVVTMFSLFGFSLVVHEIRTWAGSGPVRYVSDKSFKFYSSASQTMSLQIAICFICY